MAENKSNGAVEATAAPGSEKVTKVDAVGKALAELGQDASRSKIRDWVKEHFGYDMTLDHVSDCKKALAKRAKGKPASKKKPGPKRAALKPEVKEKPAAPQEQATPAGASSEAPVQETISKKEAVRRSLATLGDDASLKELQADIKQRFQLEMTTNHISTTKGELRREASEKKVPGKKKPGPKPGAKKARASQEPAAAPQEPAAAAAPAAATGNEKKGPVEMEDILTLRGLVDRVGIDRVRTLLDVMAR